MRITTREDPALHEIEVEVAAPRLDDQTERLVRLLRAADRRLAARDERGRTRLVDVADVLYLEAVEGRTFAYTAGEVLESRVGLLDAAEALAGSGFVRASRTLVVNLLKVGAIRPEMGSRLLLTMENGEDVLASRQYAKAIKAELGI